ncbi:MAG: hypothetical protein GKR90_15470 [Pseudomonadales bacterium]|nr:hypothetical protein [Pseudomonadales bacterium]
MRTTIAKALKGVALGGTLAAIATTGFAATDGSIGYNSTGTLNVTMTVTDEVRITNLEDVNFDLLVGVGGTVTSPACIYRNTAPGDYLITAVGDGPGGAFVMSGLLPGPPLPYSVGFAEVTGGTPGLPSNLFPNTPLPSTGAGTDDTCAAGDNGEIQVTLSAAAASTAPADSYTGVLSLTIGPN